MPQVNTYLKTSEYRRLRKIAIDEDTNVYELVQRWLRERLGVKAVGRQ